MSSQRSMSSTLRPWRFEQARHREDRADAHLVRLAAGGDEAAEDAERLEAALGRFLVAHDHAGAGAVGELAGVAGGDGKTFAAHGLEAGKAFSGGLGARTFVLRQGHFLERDGAGRLVGDRHLRGDRRELVLELAALLGGRGAALALQRIFVLLLARDAVALGDDLGGVDHGHVDLALDLEQRGILGVEAVHLVVLHQADRTRRRRRPRPRHRRRSPSARRARSPAGPRRTDDRSWCRRRSRADRRGAAPCARCCRRSRPAAAPRPSRRPRSPSDRPWRARRPRRWRGRAAWRPRWR